MYIICIATLLYRHAVLSRYVYVYVAINAMGRALAIFYSYTYNLKYTHIALQSTYDCSTQKAFSYVYYRYHNYASSYKASSLRSYVPFC